MLRNPLQQTLILACALGLSACDSKAKASASSAQPDTCGIAAHALDVSVRESIIFRDSGLTLAPMTTPGSFFFTIKSTSEYMDAHREFSHFANVDQLLLALNRMNEACKGQLSTSEASTLQGKIREWSEYVGRAIEPALYEKIDQIQFNLGEKKIIFKDFETGAYLDVAQTELSDREVYSMLVVGARQLRGLSGLKSPLFSAFNSELEAMRTVVNDLASDLEILDLEEVKISWSKKNIGILTERIENQDCKLYALGVRFLENGNKLDRPYFDEQAQDTAGVDRTRLASAISSRLNAYRLLAELTSLAVLNSEYDQTARDEYEKTLALYELVSELEPRAQDFIDFQYRLLKAPR